MANYFAAGLFSKCRAGHDHLDIYFGHVVAPGYIVAGRAGLEEPRNAFQRAAGDLLAGPHLDVPRTEPPWRRPVAFDLRSGD